MCILLEAFTMPQFYAFYRAITIAAGFDASGLYKKRTPFTSIH